MFGAYPGIRKTSFSVAFWRPKPAPEPLQKGPAKPLAKRRSLFPKNSRKVAPEAPKRGAKIRQKSHFGPSGTPQLQPTGPRHAQEGVNHPNWTQKTSKNEWPQLFRTIRSWDTLLISELKLLTHSLVTCFLSVAALLSAALLVCCLQLVSKQPGSAGLLLLRIHLFEVPSE